MSTIDEAMELLTDSVIGAKDESGSYPAESLNGRVLVHLRELGESLRAFGDYGYRERSEGVHAELCD